MKRFWKNVDVEPEGDSWQVALDGRPLRTPARRPLVVPTRTLADAISREWRGVEADVEPRDMRMTGLANAAIDRVEPQREEFAAGLARYAEADLVCYRAENPRELVERQEESWELVLAWARRRYDIDFVTTCGIAHVNQPEGTVARLAHAVGALDAFRLAGLSALVAIGGSLVISLAVLEGAISAEAAWKAVSIDEQWQLEKWGADEDAVAALQHRHSDFLAGGRFLELLDD